MAQEHGMVHVGFYNFPNRKQNTYFVEPNGPLIEQLLLSPLGKKFIREFCRLDALSYHQNRIGIQVKMKY